MHDLAEKEPERAKELAGLWEKWAQRTRAIPWPWGKPYGEEKAAPAKKAKSKKEE